MTVTLMEFTAYIEDEFDQRHRISASVGRAGY
jgi:hypothetical protein